ncbi:MAG: ribbon-helix-helix domain-containing protein [Meiothermus ruber]|jgi:predicted DNA-binding ribbon-helix-helix protein|uniref:Ribbon-helix-helix protein, CopG family n=1 Tax=Meiothermus ruber TaxID=277 RepID=A0A7C3HTD6_MEIRU|nr:ribbon-helix-helix domain-containing protein [Meiothermus ruber]
MVRTQIQLEEAQWQQLREIAHREGISIAEAVRRAVDGMLEEKQKAYRWRKEQALGVVGRFASGLRDVSKNHDRYLEEAFDPR